MRKYMLILLAVLAFSIPSIAQNGNTSAVLQGARYVKLANSYIHDGDYNKALQMLSIATAKLQNLTGQESLYWKAAIQEAYGTLFAKMNMLNEAKEHLQSALSAYKKIITMPDGSPYAVKSLIDKLDMPIGNPPPWNSVQISGGAIAGLTNIANYDDSKLKQLPSGLPNSIENISLAGNKFRDFPTELARLPNLQCINLANNKLTNINIDFSSLKKLKWLDVSNNKIKEIGNGISSATSLEYLDLSGNKLKELPIGISNLKSLKILNLKNNRIPFAKIKTLIQSMPTTNIVHDEYVPKEEDIEE